MQCRKAPGAATIIEMRRSGVTLEEIIATRESEAPPQRWNMRFEEGASVQVPLTDDRPSVFFSYIGEPPRIVSIGCYEGGFDHRHFALYELEPRSAIVQVTGQENIVWARE